MITALLQSEASGALRELMQYIGNAAAVGAFVFAWRTNTRVTRLETIMSEPELGVIPTIAPLKKGVLTAHRARLDQHDTDIERLDRDKEPRRTMQPTDVSALDRRHQR